MRPRIGKWDLRMSLSEMVVALQVFLGKLCANMPTERNDDFVRKLALARSA